MCVCVCVCVRSRLLKGISISKRPSEVEFCGQHKKQGCEGRAQGDWELGERPGTESKLNWFLASFCSATGQKGPFAFGCSPDRFDWAVKVTGAEFISLVHISRPMLATATGVSFSRGTHVGARHRIHARWAALDTGSTHAGSHTSIRPNRMRITGLHRMIKIEPGVCKSSNYKHIGAKNKKKKKKRRDRATAVEPERSRKVGPARKMIHFSEKYRANHRIECLVCAFAEPELEVASFLAGRKSLSAAWGPLGALVGWRAKREKKGI